LFRQQGRILLRLDHLEHGHANELSMQPTESPLSGVPVGAVVEDFQFGDIGGRKVALTDFRGRRVLLLYWGAECGYCDMTGAELARIQPRLKQNRTELVLAAYGDAESNRKLAAEHGLNCTILPLDGSPAQSYIADKLFEYCGTPSAYLLNENGQVAKPLAVGMDSVLALAREAAKDAAVSAQGLRRRPLSASKIQRNGLKAGTPAPDFSLPDIHGETVSLEQFRGRKVLLVFTDPQCGPCDELAPDLVQLHREHRNNGLAIVMVGRGNTELNKKKAEEHDIVFPFVLQQHWRTSRQYGIFETPVAFLIGKDGIIMRNVAKGPDQIMTMAREGVRASQAHA
jgi:peroxiredoxin